MQNVVGHDRAVAVLRQAIATGLLHHAYLITGPSRVGKTTLALTLARWLNCATPSTLCQRDEEACRGCRLIEKQAHPDVRLVELDREHSRISYKEIEQLQADASRRPLEARYKCYLILEAQRLSDTAANQLLKTLEEPPPAVVLILTALDAASLLPTIVSRCQEIRLSPLPAGAIAAHLQHRLGCDPALATDLARLAQGRIGWAIEAATQPEVLARRGAALALLLDALRGTRLDRLEAARKLAEAWATTPDHVRETLQLWCEWLRDTARLQLGLEHRVVHADSLAAQREVAQGWSQDQLRRALAALQQATLDLDLNTNARLALDVALLSLPEGRSAA